MREQIQQAIDLRDAVVTCFISGDGGELGCDVGRLYDLIDAALRAAKVEALREVKYEALGSRIKCCKSDTLYAEGNDDALNALVKWIDARAAQIEEGE